MNLRKSINRPQKLQDEIAYGKRSKDPTQPAFPEKLRAQVIPFNPHLPPAVFPSRPLEVDIYGEDEGTATAKAAADAEESSDDDCHMSNVDSLPIGLYPKMRNVPTSKSPADVAFEDEMATSDDDHGDVPGQEDNHPPFDTQNNGREHLSQQIIINHTVNWSDLCPAVQLAIISRLSERYPMSKVYDMLGLYAQELGDVTRLAQQYNYQSRMEDYLIFWMQQDQLNGILRVDHTLTLRGAPEAYQEFQTRSFMHKIQAEIDESLLQATRAAVNLGKRFLGQRSIPREMVGDWGYLSGQTRAARPHDRQVLLLNPLTPDRSGWDSGYVSAVSPDRLQTEQDTENALRSSPHCDSQPRKGPEPRETARTRSLKKVQHQKICAPAEKQTARHRSSSRARSNSPVPADDISAARSSGRSRRNVQPKQEYVEAIARLQPGAYGSEGESDCEMSDEIDKEAQKLQPNPPSTRLFITADNRLRAVPAPSTSIGSPKSSANTKQAGSNVPRLPAPSLSGSPSNSPRRIASPLPLSRVVVRPPKTMSKFKQINTIAKPSAGSVMNKFNQNLLGMSREGNDFTKSMLKASERDAAKSTPWIPVQPKPYAETSLPASVDHRRRSETAAPAFSPISERFTKLSYDGPPSTQAVGNTTHENGKLEKAGPISDENAMESPLPATPDFTSTPASISPDIVQGNRSIVTEAGSPVPARRKLSSKISTSTSGIVIGHQEQGLKNDHQLTAATFRPRATPQQPDPDTENTYPRLDPVSGIVINDQSIHQDPPSTADSITQPQIAPVSQNARPLTPLQEAGEGVKKAAANLKSIATGLTKTTLPITNLSAADPALTGPQNGTIPTFGVAKTTVSQDAPKEKRRYRKSEAQRKKEADLAEKRERDRREKEARLAMKARGREVGRAQLAATAQDPEASR
ncbi:hypothetical protein EPUS_05918 [Endocarpon pusillum Z07020]|uniref:Uncharacterized protein n=1 Tax=Endocarpon pusillum (strain Z07020 / HMAS-L-300199) TaxID=1263415 RepID=U1GPL4_ENDPU|nr:uncharacterized protein EPUS_05918 [Endocarpon pusillum Z07020]ERF73906.1 hypothetical protein EPUS_05918 [Endocarpon pusillum Z07020]